MLKKLFSLLQKFRQFLFETKSLSLLRSSDLFDENWYLSNNPDVAQTKNDPLLHYLRHGGFEGRDPGPHFSSAFYLEAYPDARSTQINPLVHYLKYGKTRGRNTQLSDLPYRCPVCSKRIVSFLPISPHFDENRRKYGYPYTFDDLETINPGQYSCPSCGASDRDRLYALYIGKVLEQNTFLRSLALLDIAPSPPLKRYILNFHNIKYQSADKYTDDVDLVIDITDMRVVESASFDMLICSHVLEHVIDDSKALSELYRILKPGGVGILMVPIILKIDKIDEDPKLTDVETRWKRFGQDDHVRLYSKKGFIERVQKSGFKVNQYNVEDFGTNVFIECGISLKSVLYVIQKDV